MRKSHRTSVFNKFRFTDNMEYIDSEQSIRPSPGSIIVDRVRLPKVFMIVSLRTYNIHLKGLIKHH